MDQAKRIAGLQCRRQRPIFSTQVKVSFAENDRTETFDVHRIERMSSRESHFNGLPGLLVHASETGRQCRGVVCYDEIVRSQKLDERSARNVNQVTL